MLFNAFQNVCINVLLVLTMMLSLLIIKGGMTLRKTHVMDGLEKKISAVIWIKKKKETELEKTEH